ncbi:MAG: hypothetical protein O6829_01580, partial [Alphaproteobacteria bacterium]|nr:hypothetical protein [Alphaproteobacteria bacterium]
WGMTWIFSTVVDADISNRQILYGAIGLIVVSGLVVGIGHTLLWLFPNQQGRFWSELRDFLDFDERVKRKRPTPAPKRNNAATADSKRSDGESNSWWELLLISFIGMALVSGVLLYSVKGVLYIWDPDLSAILSHQRILLLGVASGLGYGSFMTGAACAEWASSESRSTRSRSFLVLASAVLILFIGSVSFYSYTIYPALPQGLGGGKPIPIDLWLNSEDFPDDLRKRLAKCSPDASGRRTVCRDVRLVHADSEYLILSEKDRPPSLTFIFPKDHIQVISF